mmetsp:Transcript_23403/g.58738  ORF Transcript_23403/g.58738 Transcript_23403/m.58738 type:complete len:367 (+) Transcript_23403:72-1172(+)
MWVLEFYNFNTWDPVIARVIPNQKIRTPNLLTLMAQRCVQTNCDIITNINSILQEVLMTDKSIYELQNITFPAGVPDEMGLHTDYTLIQEVAANFGIHLQTKDDISAFVKNYGILTDNWANVPGIMPLDKQIQFLKNIEPRQATLAGLSIQNTEAVGTLNANLYTRDHCTVNVPPMLFLVTESQYTIMGLSHLKNCDNVITCLDLPVETDPFVKIDNIEIQLITYANLHFMILLPKRWENSVNPFSCMAEYDLIDDYNKLVFRITYNMDIKAWHKKLGHILERSIWRTLRAMSIKVPDTHLGFCPICCQGKICRASIGHSLLGTFKPYRIEQPGDMIIMDLAYFTYPSLDGSHWLLVWCDIFSRFA